MMYLEKTSLYTKLSPDITSEDNNNTNTNTTCLVKGHEFIFILKKIYSYIVISYFSAANIATII